jgi:NAD(P)-dependent dehydrogenase (short-subunit alcohol dehydrogenase family)
MDLQLSGKRALVTGSTAGIGLAIGSTLAGEGATVIINGRSEKRVTEAIQKILQNHPRGKLEALIGDLSKVEAVKQATSSFPHVDILVNNLGIYEVKSFENISDEAWMAIIETNFMSGVRLSRHYLPRMKERNWGRIIFISSESAINIPIEMIHYGVTKTMQLALARGLAETPAGTGVTVNSTLPGPTGSEEWNSLPMTWRSLATSYPLWWRRSSSKPSVPVRCSNGSPQPMKSPRWSRTSPGRSPLRSTEQHCAWMEVSFARSFDR